MQPVAAVSRQRCECMSSQGRTRSKLVFLKNLRERISIHFSQISQLSFLFEPVIWKEMTRRKCQPLERFPGAVRAEWTHKIRPDVTSSSFTSTLNMLLNTSAAGYFIHLWLSSVRGKIRPLRLAAYTDGHVFYPNTHNFNLLIMWNTLVQRLVGDVLNGENALLQRHQDETWLLPAQFMVSRLN